MIERYFRAGVRLKWTFPAAVFGAWDGAIVDSRSPTPAMIYDGVDAQLVSPYTSVTTLGLAMRTPIQYHWLDYALGQTARLPIGPYDVLTGEMTGCLITQWSSAGVRFVGHVGTVTDKAQENKTVKNTFARGMSADVRGFNPAAAWDFGEIQTMLRSFKASPQPKVLALVTTAGNFYSIVMLRLQPDVREPGLQLDRDWCVGGIKQVQPMNRDTLILELRKLRDT